MEAVVGGSRKDLKNETKNIKTDARSVASNGYRRTGWQPLMEYPFGVVLLVTAAFGDGVNLVRAMMQATGRTVPLMAEEAGCSRTHLSLMLNGKRPLSPGVSLYCTDGMRLRQREVDRLIDDAKAKVGDVSDRMLRSKVFDWEDFF